MRYWIVTTLLLMLLIMEDVPRGIKGQENQSQTPITINTYGSCATDEGLERRVSQLEQTVVEQQRLIMELIGARQVESVIIRDCSDVFNNGNRSDGVYTLRPTNGHSFKAYCQFDAEGTWTIIQRRTDGATDFQRSWLEYKNGFGTLDSNFWLGNDNLHALTNRRQTKLRIEITDWDGETRYADYKFFRIEGENNYFTLRYSGYSGTAGDSLGDYHKDMKFSTFDSDNDDSRGEECAVKHGGGWWYNDCDHGNMNGFYNHEPRLSGPTDSGIEWDSWKKLYSFKETVMKIKPTFAN